VPRAPQEVVRSAFERGSVHAPEGEEDEPTPVKASLCSLTITLSRLPLPQCCASHLLLQPCASLTTRSLPSCCVQAKETKTKAKAKPAKAEAEAKPKAKRGRPKKVAEPEPEDDDDEEDDVEEDEEEEEPKPKVHHDSPVWRHTSTA